MNRTFLFFLIQLTGIFSFAQESIKDAGQATAKQPSLSTEKKSVNQYNPTDQGSSVTFKIKNFGFVVSGSFTGLQGKISFDPRETANSRFEVSVDASTINTDNGVRDEHLKKQNYFDVQNYPRMHFVSTSITPSDINNTYKISGKLTIKNKTKEISFPFIATPMGNDYIFSGEFTINRKDFDIGGSSTISNNLTVVLALFAKK
ncbi:YceI family protein [Flavitalea flava]